MESALHSTGNLRDASYFESVFRTHYQAMLAYARRYIEDADQADEIVQEVFAQLWEKRMTITIDTSIKAYLFRAVRNHALNLIKHQKVRAAHRAYVETHQTDAQIDDSDSMVGTDIRESILAGIASLPPQCAKVFRMNRLEGFKYREIAEQLGISPKTVEAQMAKAMKRMRVFLKDHLPTLFFIFFQNL